MRLVRSGCGVITNIDDVLLMSWSR